MAEQKEVFFVGVMEPIQFRRELLNTSKDVINCLKKYEYFRQLRKDKAENIVKLKKLFDELTFLNGKLKQEMPKTKLRALKQPERGEERSEPISDQASYTPRVAMPRKSMTTLDKLEHELLELESKLNRLQ